MSEHSIKLNSKFERKEHAEKINQQRLEQEVIEELGNAVPHVRPHIKYSFLNWLNNACFFILTKLRFTQRNFFKASNIKAQSRDLSNLFDEAKPTFQTFEKKRAGYRVLNYYYSDQYTGSYKLNYGLAYVAVTLAVISLLILFLNTHFHCDILENIVKVMGGCKLLILLLIVLNTWQANDIDFNQRAISVRYIMEQLRAMAFLSIFDIDSLPGIHNRSKFQNKTSKKYLDDFTKERIKEIYKDNGKLKLTDKYYSEKFVKIIAFIRSEWIRDQISYQEDRYVSQKKLNQKLERQASLLNQVVFWFVAVDVLLGVCEYFGWLPENSISFVQFWITPFILLLAAVFPAMVASFNGIKSQTEARKIAERAERMVESLQSMDLAFERLLQKADALDDKSKRKELELLTKETARIMIMEVTEWTMIFARDIAEV